MTINELFERIKVIRNQLDKEKNPIVTIGGRLIQDVLLIQRFNKSGLCDVEIDIMIDKQSEYTRKQAERMQQLAGNNE